MLDFALLAQQCAPGVHIETMQRIVHVESSFNPYAIGVVGGRLERQPRNKQEAIATAKWLERNGYNFSVGLAQVNKHNFAKYGLALTTAFEACPNLYAGGEILKDCYYRAKRLRQDEQAALRDAFSCYYSGNFTTGYKQGYVLKVVNAGNTGITVPKLTQGITLQKPRKNSAPSVPTKTLRPKVIQQSTVQLEVEPAAPASSSQTALLF